MDLTEYYRLCVSLERLENGLLLLGSAPPDVLTDGQQRGWLAAVDRLTELRTALEGRLADLQGVLQARPRAEGVRPGATVAELQRQLADAAGRGAEHERTIGKMTAVGRRLIRERDELRARVQRAERTLAGLKATAEAQGVDLDWTDQLTAPPVPR
jgi:hypothetical protein